MNIIKKISAVSTWVLVFVGVLSVLFIVKPSQVNAFSACKVTNQVCKHPCEAMKENDTGVICNDQGWTCCEKIPETTLTPVVNTTADCLSKKGQCIEWGKVCPTGLLQSATCDDATPVQTCCTPQDAPAAASTAGGTGSATTLVDPLKGATINGIIGRFIALFLDFVGAIALLVFVYAGILYMTGGTSDRIKKSIETMKYAAFGLMIIMFAYVITTFYFNALTSDVPVAAKPKNVATPQ